MHLLLLTDNSGLELLHEQNAYVTAVKERVEDI